MAMINPQEAAQELIKELCQSHATVCDYPRCFVKDKHEAAWFHVELPKFGDVPDSLQEGHGVRVRLKSCYSSHCYGREITGKSLHHGSEITITCHCLHPEPHLALINAACDMYNLH